MKNKMLCIITVILMLFTLNAFAGDKVYKTQFVNHTDINVKVVAVPTVGDVNNDENITVNAHSTSDVYDVNTDGFTGGALQAAWFVDGQQLTCPPAFLPNKLNGQLYTFVLSSDKAQGYACAVVGVKKNKIF